MKYRLLLILSLAPLFYCNAQSQNHDNSITISNRIDRILNSSVKNGYSGSVLVAKNGEILLSKGYGWAVFYSSDHSKIVAHNGSNGIYFADFIRYVEDDIVVIVLSNTILNPQSDNVAWEISKMASNVNYKTKIIPKNSYELVFDYIRTNSSDKASQLPQFIENQTGASMNDRVILNRVGFNLISEKKDPDWGIALLQMNVSLFPDDGNLGDTLGEGYFLLNDKNKAIESFNKAIELKPKTNCYWCENLTNRLQDLISTKN